MILIGEQCIVPIGTIGYETKTDDDRSVIVWPATNGGILIEAKNGDRKKFFGLTVEGAESLINSLADWYNAREVK